MRAFFILVLFFGAFILMVGNLVAGVDLTSNLPAAAQTVVPSDVPAASEPQVTSIQESPVVTSQVIALVPVTGGCANPYTVRSGDSLSQIAVNCRIPLATIRQANLQITNTNLIYPGQQVNIPDGNMDPIVTTVPAEVTPAAALLPTCTCDPASIPITGTVPMLIPGTSLQVKAIHFPPNTHVDVAIGPKNTAYTVMTQGVTDANGGLTTSIMVPTVSNSQTLWVVVVSTTTTQPSTRAMSSEFNIDP